MNPNIYLGHSSPVANEDLRIACDAEGKIAVGGPGTPITVRLHNDSTETGHVEVHLYWCEPNLGTPSAFRRKLHRSGVDSELMILPNTQVGGAPPGGVTDVELGLIWTPTANTLGTMSAAHGCLFAQVEVEPIVIVWEAGDYDPSNWDPDYRLNAQQNIYWVNVPQGTREVKFGFGAGHTQNTPQNTKVRVNSDSIDSTALASYLAGANFGGALPGLGTLHLATDALVIEGAECIVASEPLVVGQQVASDLFPDNRPPIRLGNVGVISDSMADDLALGAPAPWQTMTILPNMLRQVILDIPIPDSAAPNDVVAASIVHETRWRYVRTPPKTIGSSIVVVRIV